MSSSAAASADDEADVPPYMTPGEIAEACRWSRKRTTKQLEAAGLIERREKRTWRRVDTSRLLERLPALYRRVYRALVIRKRSLGASRKSDLK